MSDQPIEPVLSGDEWGLLNLWLVGKMPGGKVRGSHVLSLPEEHQRAAIAVANAALPDDDPRKITRELVALLRDASIHYTTCASFDDANPSTAECDCNGPSRSARFADALESYLPPE